MKTREIEFAIENETQSTGLATLNPPSIAGMDACIEDARRAALDKEAGLAEPHFYAPLLGRLEAARTKLPPLYRDSMVVPFITTLRQLGEEGFNWILISDPNREGLAGLMMDIAQAILQPAEGFAKVPTDAFEEAVTDLYDGFLSAEDRRGVQPPDRGVIPPLVKWGNPDFGPYTWPVDATSTFGCRAAVVNLPPANARRGLVAWAALGHETAGHDILHADTGLEAELAVALREALHPLGHDLDQYWSSRIDETASDFMGILNTGPAAGVGLIVYFRALNAAFTGQAKLRSEGPDEDPHPADVLRGYLAAETVALLKFTGHRAWSNLIADETFKDVDTIVLAGQMVAPDVARQSAKLVAQTLARYHAQALENHALAEIQNWRDSDERKVKLIRSALRQGREAPTSASPFYAAHAVAAAVTEALADGRQIHSLFNRMVAMLSVMHGRNASWGPLRVGHPGNIHRDRAYYPQLPTPTDGHSRSVRLLPRKLVRRKGPVRSIKLSPARHRG